MKQVIKKSRVVANNIDDEEKIYTLLVDGNNLLKISLVNHDMVTSYGKEYGAVFLFLNTLGQILAKKNFNFCYVFWDGDDGGELRYQEYKDYKANRENKHFSDGPKSAYDKYLDNYAKRAMQYSREKRAKTKGGVNESDDEIFQRQRGIIQEILENLYVRQGVFDEVEGDDLIGYYCKCKKSNEKVIIVSTDKDLTQLISSDVAVYNSRKKYFISANDSVEKLGITHENVVLEKIICGDSSDNIKGIKGVGEQSLLKYFPELKDKRGSLEEVIEKAKVLLDERKKEKKKPLKMLENIVNRVTDGIQGERIYEINRKIIDLSEPLMTKDALNGMDSMIGAPIDSEGRSVENIYRIIQENGMDQMTNSDSFGRLFGFYNRIIMMEKKFFEECMKKE